MNERKESMILKLMAMLIGDDESTKTKEVVTVEPHPFIDKYCVIRTYSAGVHCGFVKSIDGCEVIIEDCRQIYYWKGAFTLRELSLNGVSEGSKITAPVPLNSLTKIELIPVSEEAAKILQEYKSYEIWYW
ncbi:MAG: hypothetical protein GY679_01085 [Mycoplasma sp.]|nr:hypothetical protein [Mycoplasma sp.]